MNKDIRQKFILLFVSILVSLLIVEIGLSAFMKYRHRYFKIIERNGVSYYISNPYNWNILQGQSFFREKPKDTYRIFTFGGSTTEGAIHMGKVSFTKFLEMKLHNILPSVNFEIINFGKSGETSKHVLEKVRIALEKEPDLFIIYSGHNEYIRFDEKTVNDFSWIDDIFAKSYLYNRLIKRVLGMLVDQSPLYITEKRRFEDKLICNPYEFKVIQEEYRSNLNEIIKLAKDSNINIILANVVGNYKGWEPNRSVHKLGLSDDEIKMWRHYFFRGREFLNKRDFKSAIADFEIAKKIDDTFAELNYLSAKADEGIGLYDHAKKEYLRAIDNDGDPKIASTFFNNVIKELCHNYKIPCVDVISAFENVSENSLIGYNIMVDAHHPSMYGELIIAEEIIKVMVEKGIPVPAYLWSFENDKSNNWYLKEVKLNQEDMILYHQNRGMWFLKLSVRRYDPKDRLQRARHHFEKALNIDSTAYRTYIGFSILHLLENNLDEAKRNIQKACKINMSGTINVLKDKWISSVFSKHVIKSICQES